MDRRNKEKSEILGFALELGAKAGILHALNHYCSKPEKLHTCIKNQSLRYAINDVGHISLSHVKHHIKRDFPAYQSSSSDQTDHVFRSIYLGYILGLTNINLLLKKHFANYHTSKTLSFLNPKKLNICWVYSPFDFFQDKSNLNLEKVIKSLINCFPISNEADQTSVNDIIETIQTDRVNFLNADFMMLVKSTDRLKKNHYELISIDFSNVYESDDVLSSEPLPTEKTIANRLSSLFNQAKNTLRVRNYKIEDDGLGLSDYILHNKFKEHAMVLMREDKALLKCFQAAGYAGHLLQHFPSNEKIICTAIGLTNANKRFFRSHNHDKLQQLFNAYETYTAYRKNVKKYGKKEELFNTQLLLSKIFNETFDNIKAFEKHVKKSIKTVRDSLELNSKTIYPDEFVFTQKVHYTPTQYQPTEHDLITWLGNERGKQIYYSLQKSSFVSMQVVHGKMIESIWDETDLIVLAGAPGAGKTTQLVNEYIKKKDNTTLIYASPRITVNDDFVEKTSPITNNDFSVDTINHAVTITSDSNLIALREGIKTVCAHSINNINNDIFINPDERRALEQSSNYIEKSGLRLKALSEYESNVQNKINSGVLSSLSDAYNYLVNETAYSKIAITFAIQAFKKIGKENTLTNTFFSQDKGIFAKCLSGNELLLEPFKNLCKKINTLVFVIDELTGDDAGRDLTFTIFDFFFSKNGLKAKFKRATNDQEVFPLTVKIVFSDASLVSAQAIGRIFSSRDHIPSIISIKNCQSESKPLSIDPTKILGKDALCVGANFYPAKQLIINYRPCMKFLKEKDDNRINDVVDEYIFNSLVEFQKKYPSQQQIVFLQNKQRLYGLSDKLKEKKIQCEMIHGDTPSDKKKALLSKIKKTDQPVLPERIAGCNHNLDIPDVILITSSATRGISFPNATRLVISVPNFSVASNLMEVNQGIFRGRGGEGNNLERTIDVIIDSEVWVFDDMDDQHIFLRTFDISSFMYLIDMAIKTRISGASKIKSDYFETIPLGRMGVGYVQNDIGHKLKTNLDTIQKHEDILKNETALEGINTIKNYLSNNEYNFKTTNANQLFNSFAQTSKQSFYDKIQFNFKNLIHSPVYSVIPDYVYPVAPGIVGINLNEVSSQSNVNLFVNNQLEDTFITPIKKIYKMLYAIHQNRHEKPTIRKAAADVCNWLENTDILNEKQKQGKKYDFNQSIKNMTLVVPIESLYSMFSEKDETNASNIFEMLLRILNTQEITTYYAPLHSIEYLREAPYLLVDKQQIMDCIDADYSSKTVTTTPLLSVLQTFLACS